MPIKLPNWKSGSVCGCFIDLDSKEIEFSLDGVTATVVNKEIFADLRWVRRTLKVSTRLIVEFISSNGFFPAASFMSFQQCRFNFGAEKFKFPPNRPFNIFNDFGQIQPQDKVRNLMKLLQLTNPKLRWQIVLPKHKFLEELRKLSVTEDSCTLCFDSIANIKLQPCGHTGFCSKCSSQLQICPICRSEIASVEFLQEIAESSDKS